MIAWILCLASYWVIAGFIGASMMTEHYMKAMFDSTRPKQQRIALGLLATLQGFALLPLLLPPLWFSEAVDELRRDEKATNRINALWNRAKPWPERIVTAMTARKTKVADWLLARNKIEIHEETVAESREEVSPTYRTPAARTVTRTEVTRVTDMPLTRRLTIAVRFGLVSLAVAALVGALGSGSVLYLLASLPITFAWTFGVTFFLTHAKWPWWLGAVCWMCLGAMLGHESAASWWLYLALILLSLIWGFWLSHASWSKKTPNAAFLYFPAWYATHAIPLYWEASPLFGLWMGVVCFIVPVAIAYAITSLVHRHRANRAPVNYPC